MIKRYGEVLFVGLVLFCGQISVAESTHRLGVGVHYLTTIDNVDLDRGEEDGMSYLFSYQYGASDLLKLEIEVEMLPDNWLGATEDIFAPKVLLLLGSGIYVGAGVGMYYADGDFADESFYLVRAGLNFELLPSLFIDVNLNYQFEDYEGFDAIQDDIDSDTLTVGASARIAL